MCRSPCKQKRIYYVIYCEGFSGSADEEGGGGGGGPENLNMDRINFSKISAFFSFSFSTSSFSLFVVNNPSPSRI